jgi:hypothetical protein
LWVPDFCTVESHVVCPRCGETSPPRIVYFQWGKVPHEYQLSDEIEWLRDPQGQLIEPFKLVARKSILGGTNHYWNCGEPQHLNVLAFDNDAQRGPIHCRKCGEHLTVAALIQGGKVAGARTLSAVEARALGGRDPDDLGIAIINDDGSYSYRSDWDDPPFS